MRSQFLAISIFTATVALLSLSQNSSAHIVPVSEIVTAFRQLIDISPQIKTPTVVQVPLTDIFLERHDFAILDQTTSTFEPYLFRQTTQLQPAPLTVTSTAAADNINLLVDNNVKTDVQFDVTDSGLDTVQLTLISPRLITASGLSALLSPNVALPTHVEVRATVDGTDKIVVARQAMLHSTVHWPTTVASRWTVTFTYGQPLRIAELRLIEEDTATDTVQSVRFLAQPEHTYRIYLDADRSVTEPHHGEAANLQSEIDVVSLAASSPQANPAYIIADSDSDGTPDINDNCVSDANPDQLDANNNGRGDFCDDFDKDGVINNRDNCRDNPNRNQADIDGDGSGDACDDQESRLTEANPWLPWAAMGLAVGVVIGLFALTAHGMRTKKASSPNDSNDTDHAPTTNPPPTAPPL